jgi:hypothetical protein
LFLNDINERTRRPIPSKPMKKMELKSTTKKIAEDIMKMLPFFHPEKTSVGNCSNDWLRGGQQHLRDFRFPSVP